MLKKDILLRTEKPTIFVLNALNYIFRYLLHFAIKLSNFTNLNKFSSAVVKDFVRIAWIQI